MLHYPQHNFEPQRPSDNIIIKTISGIGYDGYDRETDIHILCAIAQNNIHFWNNYFDKVTSVHIQVNPLIYVKCYTA